MGKPKHFYHDPKKKRDMVNEAADLGVWILKAEARFIEKLEKLDETRYYIRTGARSLRGFVMALGFSRTQAQRIVTQVRQLRSPTSEDRALARAKREEERLKGHRYFRGTKEG